MVACYFTDGLHQTWEFCAKLTEQNFFASWTTRNMRYSLLTLAIYLNLAKGQTQWKVGNAVKTTSGTVVGQASHWKPEVSEYLGIPFAKPPEGDLRWAPPQAITDASKVINATQYVRYVHDILPYIY
jgi:hypothetical protein